MCHILALTTLVQITYGLVLERVPIQNFEWRFYWLEENPFKTVKLRPLKLVHGIFHVRKGAAVPFETEAFLIWKGLVKEVLKMISCIKRKGVHNLLAQKDHLGSLGLPKKHMIWSISNLRYKVAMNIKVFLHWRSVYKGFNYKRRGKIWGFISGSFAMCFSWLRT